jgi:hypothetical protein
MDIPKMRKCILNNNEFGGIYAIGEVGLSV